MNTSRSLFPLLLALVCAIAPASAANAPANAEDPFAAANATTNAADPFAADTPSAPGQTAATASAADASQPLPWNWASTGAVTSSGPKPANTPTLLPTNMDVSDVPAGDVQLTIMVNDQQARYNVKKGTSAIDALTMAGAGPSLTDAAIILINTRANYQVNGNAFQAEDEVYVDVGAVRSGKAKDVTFDAIKAGNYQIFVWVVYAEFHFPGGRPADFVAALEKHFGVDWGVAHIPPELRNVLIPEFRESVPEYTFRQNVDGQRQVTGQLNISEVERVVDLYNAIAAKYPAIGTWSIGSGPDDASNYYHPNIMELVPPAKTQVDTSNLKVVALPLADIPEADWDALEQDIARARDLADNYRIQTNSVGGGPDGTVSFQRESKILVIIGNQGYIDLVESVLAARERNDAITKSTNPFAPAKP